jgi:HPt (histidine-containing phosphotransfer) domain-containing protein
LAELIGNDPLLIAQFLQDFRASAAHMARDIEAACSQGDFGGTVVAAHKLKSAARSVGAKALGELCADLEAAAGAEQADAIAALAKRFVTEMQAVDDYLVSLRPAPAQEGGP